LRIRVDRDDCVALPQEKFRVLAIIKPDVEHDIRMLAQLCERARGILIVQDAQSSGNARELAPCGPASPTEEQHRSSTAQE
jgi:hypothetical protein